MAIVALFVAGSLIGSYLGAGLAIAGTIGGIIGSLAGGYIDSQITFPALFGSDSAVSGPRITDFNFQSASEGSPLKRCFGRANKVAGTVIWISPLIERRHREHHGGKGGPSVTTTEWTYFVSIAVAVCAGEVYEGGITAIYADAKKIYTAADGPDHRAKSVTVYGGTSTQTPNPLMETYLGAGNVPGYRGTCYVVIEELALADFGNRVPNLQFDVAKTPANQTVASVLTELLEEAGLSGDDFDVSGLPTVWPEDCVRGFTLQSPMQARGPIEMLMTAFNLYVQVKDGKLCFFKRGSEDVVDVPAGSLAARAFDDKPPRPVTVSDTPGFELPAEATVSYLDMNSHLQTGLQRARRTDFVVDGVNSVEFPLAMTATEARQRAERRLWTAWAEREAMAFTLPPSFLHLLEGDVVNVPDGSETYSGRVTTVERGANFLNAVKAVKTQSQSRDADNASGEDGVWTDPGLYVPPALVAAWIDGPALREEDIYAPRLYWAVCAESPTAAWLSASAWDSFDDVSFSLAGTTAVEGGLGEAASELPEGEALPEAWDLENHVDVELFDGEPSSASEDEVLNGVNRAFVGAELVGFTTAEDLGGGVWRLSGLLRGLRDTPLSGHAVGERVLLLSPTGAVQGLDYTSSQIGTTRHVRAVAVGGDVLAATSEHVPLGGGTVRCFSPAHLSGSRDAGTGDWTLSWFRRTRAWTRLFQEAPVPLEEATERYEVDVLDGSDVVRTIAVDGTPGAVYAAAQQVEDFGSAQTTVSVKVYQIGAVLGRGKAAEGTLNG